MEKKKNILLDNYLVKNLRAYPVLKKKFMHYIEGTKELPEGFTKRKSKSHEQLALRRNKQCHSRQPEHIPCQRYW